MNKKTIQYNNFEIDVVKRDDNIMITCLDKLMHKSYQDTFTNVYTFEVLGINNLRNFFNIINHSFDNNTFTIVSINNNIILHIIYNGDLEFNFNLTLPLIEHTQLTANSLYINKLEEKIEELKQLVRICVGIGNGGSQIMVPLYIDLLNITTYNYDIIMPNVTNNYRVHGVSYNNTTKELHVTLGLGNNTYSLTPDFMLLQPKKITFGSIPLDKIDYSCFPKKR